LRSTQSSCGEAELVALHTELMRMPSPQYVIQTRLGVGTIITLQHFKLELAESAELSLLSSLQSGFIIISTSQIMQRCNIQLWQDTFNATADNLLLRRSKLGCSAAVSTGSRERSCTYTYRNVAVLPSARSAVFCQAHFRQSSYAGPPPHTISCG